MAPAPLAASDGVAAVREALEARVALSLALALSPSPNFNTSPRPSPSPNPNPNPSQVREALEARVALTLALTVPLTPARCARRWRRTRLSASIASCATSTPRAAR